MVDLQTEIAEVEAEIKRLESDIEPILEALGRKRHELRLLKELFALHSGQPPNANREGTATTAIEILRQVGRPMTVQELVSAFARRGLKVPGKGNTTNLISYLRRTDGISRQGRGLYGLTEWEGKK